MLKAVKNAVGFMKKAAMSHEVLIWQQGYAHEVYHQTWSGHVPGSDALAVISVIENSIIEWTYPPIRKLGHGDVISIRHILSKEVQQFRNRNGLWVPIAIPYSLGELNQVSMKEAK